MALDRWGPSYLGFTVLRQTGTLVHRATGIKVFINRGSMGSWTIGTLGLSVSLLAWSYRSQVHLLTCFQ